MFYNCKSLSVIDVDFLDWSLSSNTDRNTNHWVVGVSSTGVFIKPLQLAEIYGLDYIPSGWTVQNK
jgi:hypothetical protein